MMTNRKNVLLLPKRISELPPLESESDDDGDNKGDSENLNQNILNSSFIEDSDHKITPFVEKKVVEKTTGIKLPEDRVNVVKKNECTIDNVEDKFRTIKFSTISRRLEFKADAKDSNKFLPNPDLVVQPQNSLTNIKLSATVSQSPPHINTAQPNKTRSLGDKISTDLRDEHHPLEDDMHKICADRKTKSDEFAKEKVVEPETPYQKTENIFETPMVKFQMPPMVRVSRLNSKTHGLGNVAKSSSSRPPVTDTNLRPQKILFTTPITVSRPPLSSRMANNDSISLSIDNSIVSDHKHELSPVKELKKKSFNLDDDDDDEKGESKGGKRDKNLIEINGNFYKIENKIGSGGSSSVFLAMNTITNTECALKIVHLQGDRSVVEGYLNETKLLAKLQGNINIVKLYDYQHLVKESILYMVMEKGDTDLNDILNRYKHKDDHIPLYMLVRFWYQILQSVEYIHKNGVIHSDLKPANFLIVNDRLKLIDFGIASNISIDSTSIIKYSQAGTFNYISPEALIDTSTGTSPVANFRQQPKIKISTKSDVWSLGCIFYLFLYNRTPFEHLKNYCVKATAITNPQTVIDYPNLPFYYPPMLLDMVRKCLKHNPKQRSSVSELLNYPFDKIIEILK